MAVADDDTLKCQYDAFPGWWCSREVDHDGPCALRREYPSVPGPWWERKIGDWSGNLLAWLGRRAWDRGDVHEFEHLRQALIHGNSNHEDPRWPCRLA